MLLALAPLLFALTVLLFHSMSSGFNAFFQLGFQRLLAVHSLLVNATVNPAESFQSYIKFINGVEAVAMYVKSVQLLAPYLILNLLDEVLFFKLFGCLISLSIGVTLLAVGSKHPHAAIAAILAALVSAYFALLLWNIASLLSLETRMAQLVSVNVDAQLTSMYGSNWSLFLKAINGIDLAPRDLVNPSLFSMLYYVLVESRCRWILEVGLAFTASLSLAALIARKLA